MVTGAPLVSATGLIEVMTGSAPCARRATQQSELLKSAASKRSVEIFSMGFYGISSR
jgi:hypothetical protein